MQITQKLCRSNVLRPSLVRCKYNPPREHYHGYDVYKGGCHCGSLRYEYTAQKDFKHWKITECPCSFCRKHNSLNVSDTHGKLEFNVEDSDHLNSYQFGTKKCEFWMCNNCGTYIGALTNGQKYATINVNTLDKYKNVLQEQNHHKFSSELAFNTSTAEQKMKQREKIWTPVKRIKIGNRTIVNKESKEY